MDTCGLFVLNITSKIVKVNSSNSAYIVESIYLWQGMLGHVNVAFINRLSNLNPITVVSV